MAQSRTPMSAVDTAWLRMESPASAMMIGAVLVFDRPIAMAAFRELLNERFLRYRRFRQRVVKHNERYFWEDDEWFDLDNHLHVVALPGKGCQKALQNFASDLNSTPLNHCHPLWQAHYVDGYQGGCALVIRIHHCIADGISLVRVLLSLTDDQPTANVRALRSRSHHTPDQLPEWRKVLHRIRRNSNIARNQLGQLASNVMEDPSYLSRLAKEGMQMGRDLAQLTFSAEDPVTALKGDLCGRKQVAWSDPLDLAEVKATARAMGGTVNDVLMCAATGALHSFLKNSGQPLPKDYIHVAVPFNLRLLNQPITNLGNQFGLVLVPLPVQSCCPRDRFNRIHRDMINLKQTYQAQVSFGLLDVLGRGPELLERRALEMLSRKASAVMTNVPGPRKPLYMCGGRLVQPMFWVPQTGEVGIGLSIFSYADQVQFGVISDQRLIAKPVLVTQAFTEAFQELRDLALNSGSGDGGVARAASPLN
ncbi:MAG: wax ester/triacylglycerol synthase family O-acyltransferase [Halomonadaceae bacterium]|nr:MAG: wax ester/triacylglycerol synthase family O-acyltransferase [Halomonadaceae bacterium]